MNLILNKNSSLLLLFSVFCFVSFQFTEIKIYSIKVSELVSLLCLPILIWHIKLVNKYFFYLLLYFILLLVASILMNLNQEFYFNLNSLSILRKPYFISISRFVEFISCLVFAIIVYESIKYFIVKNISIKEIINSVLSLNYYFGLFLLLLTGLYFFKIISFRSSDIIYDTTPYLPTYTLRLRGYYIEGGPFGLMYAFLFCLSSLINQKKYLQKAVFILVILLAQSKAGLIAVLGWVFFKLFLKFGHTKLVKYIIFLLIIPVFLFLAFKIADNYVDTFNKFDKELVARKKDETLIMGRTAAFLIAPRMVAHHPITGVGLGNYSLVRNNPTYLGILPAVNGWDLPGLGGILTLLIENGLIGLLMFILILWLIYKRYSRISLISRYAIIIFCIICSLGVQLYFIYIWFLIGLAISAPEYREVNLNEHL